jgi:hypothetical protein
MQTKQRSNQINVSRITPEKSSRSHGDKCLLMLTVSRSSLESLVHLMRITVNTINLIKIVITGWKKDMSRPTRTTTQYGLMVFMGGPNESAVQGDIEPEKVVREVYIFEGWQILVFYSNAPDGDMSIDEDAEVHILRGYRLSHRSKRMVNPKPVTMP